MRKGKERREREGEKRGEVARRRKEEKNTRKLTQSFLLAPFPPSALSSFWAGGFSLPLWAVAFPSLLKPKASPFLLLGYETER